MEADAAELRPVAATIGHPPSKRQVMVWRVKGTFEGDIRPMLKLQKVDGDNTTCGEKQFVVTAEEHPFTFAATDFAAFLFHGQQDALMNKRAPADIDGTVGRVLGLFRYSDIQGVQHV
jgi:hypothetical protein